MAGSAARTTESALASEPAISPLTGHLMGDLLLIVDDGLRTMSMIRRAVPARVLGPPNAAGGWTQADTTSEWVVADPGIAVMKRAILAFAVALVLWILVISLLDRGLRLLIAGYAAAEPTMSFTPVMFAARLTISALTSLFAGAVAGWIAPASPRMPLLLGATLLAAFIPVHLKLWSLFPFWYHLIFLITLIPLVVLGARVSRAAVSAGTSPA
jgi:hypothetical protein